MLNEGLCGRAQRAAGARTPPWSRAARRPGTALKRSKKAAHTRMEAVLFCGAVPHIFAVAGLFLAGVTMFITFVAVPPMHHVVR